MDTQAADTSQDKNTRILLVEDDEGVRDATCLFLNVEGFHTIAVCSRQEALHEARVGNGFDLVVADYHLAPGTNGIEVVAALRAIVGKSLKAVLITGDTSTAIRELPRDPTLAIVTKPIAAEELLRLVRALLDS